MCMSVLVLRWAAIDGFLIVSREIRMLFIFVSHNFFSTLTECCYYIKWKESFSLPVREFVCLRLM